MVQGQLGDHESIGRPSPSLIFTRVAVIAGRRRCCVSYWEVMSGGRLKAEGREGEGGRSKGSKRSSLYICGRE